MATLSSKPAIGSDSSIRGEAQAPPIEFRGTSMAPEKTSRFHPPLAAAWGVWTIAALFYLMGFYQRVSPSVMTDELMRAFSIGAGSLGTLSAFYYYFYVAMQIPTGVLIDMLGARKLLISGAVVATLGAVLFGSTSSFFLACAGRAIIGASTAVGWVVLLKLTTHWFPGRKFATLSGLGLLFGNLGALTAQVPLRISIQHFGWRPVVLASAAAVALVGVLALFIVRNDPMDKGFESHAPASMQLASLGLFDLLRGFRNIFSYRNTWLIFLSQGGIVGSILTFTGLWGTPYLRVRYGLQLTQAAMVCSIMTACWAIASPICGALSDRICRRKPIYVGGCIIAACGWACMFFIPGLPLGGFIAFGALTAVASGAVVIGFAFGKESVPAQFLGTISGTVNIGNMIGPMILQPAVGHVLDHFWTGQTSKGVHLYSPSAYHKGFLLMLGWLFVSTILLSLTRETRCKQT